MGLEERTTDPLTSGANPGIFGWGRKGEGSLLNMF